MSRRGGDMERKRKLREQWYISILNTTKQGLNSREEWEKLLN